MMDEYFSNSLSFQKTAPPRVESGTAAPYKRKSCSFLNFLNGSSVFLK